MGFLAMILGPLMRMLYQMIPNFAVTMIVFTVIIKLLMLPLMIKQQKSMAKMSVFTPMVNEIQQKYKNNQEKMQEEMVKLQQEYGYSPTAGCLPMLVNMLVLFGIWHCCQRRSGPDRPDRSNPRRPCQWCGYRPDYRAAQLHCQL